MTITWPSVAPLTVNFKMYTEKKYTSVNSNSLGLTNNSVLMILQYLLM